MLPSDQTSQAITCSTPTFLTSQNTPGQISSNLPITACLIKLKTISAAKMYMQRRSSSAVGTQRPAGGLTGLDHFIKPGCTAKLGCRS